jgi:hypothetical protein
MPLLSRHRSKRPEARHLAGDAPIEERTKLSKYRLDQQVELWLSAVRRDVDTPDLWAELQRESELLGLVSDEAIDNTPFSAAEQEELARELRTLSDQLRRTYSLSNEQVRLLDESLDYLVDAARRGVGRKDWLLMLTGVLLTYGLTAALPPAAAAHIFALLVKIVGHFLHAHGLLALPGGG